MLTDLVLSLTKYGYMVEFRNDAPFECVWIILTAPDGVQIDRFINRYLIDRSKLGADTYIWQTIATDMLPELAVREGNYEQRT